MLEKSQANNKVLNLQKLPSYITYKKTKKSWDTYISDTELSKKTIIHPQKKNFDAIHRKDLPIGPSILLFTALILFGIAKAFTPKTYHDARKAIVNPSLIQQIIRKEGAITNISILLFFISFSITIGLLCSFFLHWTTGSSFYLQFPKLFITPSLIMLTYILKYIFLLFTGQIFKIKTLGYLYDITLFNTLLSILTLPLCILLQFNSLISPKYIFWFSLFLAAIVYLIRSIRLLGIAREQNISVFHIFSYLCVLEILPTWVMIKYLMSLIA